MSQVGRRRVVAAALLAALLAAQLIVLGLAGAQTGPPPPTPVPPDGRLSPFPSVLHTPRDPVAAPTPASSAALLGDLDDGTVLFRKDASTPRPIASLTKIMTALVVLERTAPNDVVRVGPAAVFARGDYGAGSVLGLRVGERIRVRDLLYALLLGSANDAAVALAIHVSGSTDAFIELMDRRAAQLGMSRTSFMSPHGLDDRGRSTPVDLFRLVRAADALPRFRSIVATRAHRIPDPLGPPRRIQNRNALLWLYEDAVGTKTGTTALAGPCLIGAAERDGRRLVAIVLDAAGEAFSDAATLLEHGFEGFTEQTLVRAGDDVGIVSLRGGEVRTFAATSLTAVVPTALLDHVRREIDVPRSAAFPPAPGETVATMTVSVPGRTIGVVPLEAQRLPPPDAVEGSWWGRALGALAGAVASSVGALAD